MADTALGGGGLLGIASIGPESQSPQNRQERNKKRDPHRDGNPSEDGQGAEWEHEDHPAILDMETARRRAAELEARLDGLRDEPPALHLRLIEELLSVDHLLVAMQAARMNAEAVVGVADKAAAYLQAGPEAVAEVRKGIEVVRGEDGEGRKMLDGLRYMVRSLALKARAVAAESKRAAHHAPYPRLAGELRSVAGRLEDLIEAMETVVAGVGPVTTYGRTGAASPVPEEDVVRPHVLSTEA